MTSQEKKEICGRIEREGGEEIQMGNWQQLPHLVLVFLSFTCNFFSTFHAFLAQISQMNEKSLLSSIPKVSLQFQRLIREGEEVQISRKGNKQEERNFVSPPNRRKTFSAHLTSTHPLTLLKNLLSPPPLLPPPPLPPPPPPESAITLLLFFPPPPSKKKTFTTLSL